MLHLFNYSSMTNPRVRDETSETDHTQKDAFAMVPSAKP